MTLQNLAAAYRRASQFAKVPSLLSETLEILRVERGTDHPETLKSRERLAVALRDSEEFAEAVELLTSVLNARQTELGAEHPMTLLSMYNLAGAHKAAGNLEQSLPFHERAATGMERLGFRHEAAAQCVRNTIAAYQEAEQFEEADRWQEKWSAFIKADPGAESVAHATELVVFGTALLKRADWDRAEEVLR